MTADIITLPTALTLCQQFDRTFVEYTPENMTAYLSITDDELMGAIEQTCDALRQVLSNTPDRAERAAERMDDGLRKIFFRAKNMKDNDTPITHICADANAAREKLLREISEQAHHHVRHHKQG